MADSGRHTEEGAQRAESGGQTGSGSADAPADLGKKKEQGTENGKLKCILDGAVDGDVHIKIGEEQKCKQKNEYGEAERGMCGAKLFGARAVGEEKGRGKNGGNPQNGKKSSSAARDREGFGQASDQNAKAGEEEDRAGYLADHGVADTVCRDECCVPLKKKRCGKAPQGAENVQNRRNKCERCA